MQEMIIALMGCSGIWAIVMEIVRALINRKSGLTKRLDTMTDKLAQIEASQAQDRAMYARNRIVKFNDELLNGIRHSKSMFDSILIDCTDYEKYCDDHKDFRNGVATMAIENIKRCYRKCEEEKDFL